MLQLVFMAHMIVLKFGLCAVIEIINSQKRGMVEHLFTCIMQLAPLSLNGLGKQNGSRKCGKELLTVWLKILKTRDLIIPLTTTRIGKNNRL